MNLKVFKPTGKTRIFALTWNIFFTLILPIQLLADSRTPPSLEDSQAEPVKYVGSRQTDKLYFHGKVRPAVGVHKYQALRVNRSEPPEVGSNVGWTYNHQPYLTFWNERFYLQYLSNLKEEHNPPGRTLLMTSKDGFDWSRPEIVFPVYTLPEIDDERGNVPKGMTSVMHQRMGFYIAPNGRLLTLAFYSYCPTPRDSPNSGKGLGRVVREVYKNGKLGPIYFIRYNRHAGWNERNTDYPFFSQSKDAGFVEACQDLLQDKLKTLQWWEEDRAEDGFFTIKSIDEENPPKALSYYHRPDGVVVGVWKKQVTALSADEGQTWTQFALSKTLMTCGAKVWGQATEDGRFALVYNHSATRRNRYPLVVMTGDDGHEFDNMLSLQSEVPPMRYQGIHKNRGPQYIRGIAEGNGNPPGQHLWNTFSMNKEDIWVSRTRLPVSGTVGQHVNQNFDSINQVSDLEYWNLHIPQWAPITIASSGDNNSHQYLEFRDEDPYDYALAERTFPESVKGVLQFRVQAEQFGHNIFEIELQDQYNERPLRLRIDPDWLSLDINKVNPRPLPISPGLWHEVKIRFNCKKQSYDLALNGKWLRNDVEFANPVETIERIVFRTGSWRGHVPRLYLEGNPGNPGLDEEDLPGSDVKVPLSVFRIDDLKTSSY